MGMIDDWVNNFCEPIIEDQAKCEQLVAAAREHRDEFLLLEKYVASCPDLMRGSMYPDTDIDILTAVVMRYVYNNVFRHDVFGSSSELGKAVHFIATAMRDSAEPKRGEFTPESYKCHRCPNTFLPFLERKKKVKKKGTDCRLHMSSCYLN